MSHKYHAVATTVDGHRFPSKREADRYCELRLLEKGKAISDLELQPKFPCVVNGMKVCTYIADFRYLEKGQTVVEDAKGFKTKDYRIKKKLAEALFEITIKEV